MKKRILGGLIFLVFVIALASSLYAPFTGKWISSETDFWKIATIGAPASGDWTPYFESFPKSYKYEIYRLDEAEGMKLFVQLPSGSKEDILLIYTSPSSYSLWDSASYFVFEGGSIYSEFDAPKLDGRYMRETYGEDKVFDKINNYVFPSEDHPIFIIKFELDTSMGNQLVIHEIDFAPGGRDLFTEDIQHFKDNSKVPVSGTGLKLTPSTFNRASPKKIEFEFTAPEDFDEGYLLYIVTEPIDKTEAEIIEMINDGDLVGKLEPIFVSADAVYTKGAVLKGSIEQKDRLELIQDLDKGKYFVYVGKVIVSSPSKALVGAFLTIEGETPATPCNKCATILECLACVDQAFVKGVFKE